MHVRGVSFTALICALFLTGGIVLRTSAVIQPASASTLVERFNTTVVPYWRVDEGLDSLVTLNNSLNREREVLITLYDEEGQVLAEASHLLEPRETRQLSASRLLGRPKEVHWGWLEISQAGHAYDIGVLGQVWDRSRQETLDVPGWERPQFKSSRLVGLAPSTAGNELIVINTADEERAVKLVVRSGSSVLRRQSTLSSKQVWRIQLNKMVQRPANAPLLVSLEAGNGVAGDVMGGILWGGVDSVSGYIGLADPALRASSRLSMTHLYGAQRSTTQHPLALQNTGPSLLSVQGVLTLGGNGQEPVRRSMQWDLMPYGGRTIPLERDLERARGDWEWATLDLEWDGPPGALLAHSYSIDSRRGLALRNPLVDPEQERKKASNYPLRVGNGYNTRISIKNPTDEPRRFIGHYFLEGGEEYGTGVVTIPAGETHAIDLAQLQRETIPDRFQRTLPPGELGGQFLWFPLKSPYQLIGRAVTELEGSGIVTSLSCFQCGTPVPEFLELTPFEIAIPGFVPGALELHTVDALQTFRICGGGQSFDEAVTEFVSFSSNNLTVATVATGGNITVRAPGQATIEGALEFEREICNLATCEPVLFGVITVLATSILTSQELICEITGPQTLLIGENVTSVTTNVSSGATISNLRLVQGNSVCYPLSPSSKTIGARVPGQAKLQMDCRQNGNTRASNLFTVTGAKTPQYVGLNYTNAANTILATNFSATRVQQIKSRIVTNLNRLFITDSNAYVIIANQPAGGVTRITTLTIEGNNPQSQQGGEASFDRLNFSRQNQGRVFIGTGSLNLLSALDPVPATTSNERQMRDRVADAITRLAAHEIGHMLGLVSRTNELTGPIFGPLATKLNVSNLLNGTVTHHDPSGTRANIMRSVVDLNDRSGWEQARFQFTNQEELYLGRILPRP